MVQSRNTWVRAATDYAGPLAFLIAFFASRNILTATWALVGVSAVALVLGFVIERRVATLPLLWGLAALVFGLLTLVFHDPRFVKMKPTIVDVSLGVFLLGGLLMGKSPIRLLMGQAVKLTEAGWRKLTLRFGVFFIAMAALNEIVWRTQPDSVWVVFRMPGLPLLAVLFSLTQVPLMMKDARAIEAALSVAEPQE